MTVSRISALLLGSSLLLSASVFAANSNKKSLHLYETVTVEGKQLAPGDYKFEWSGTGPDVQVSILKGKDTVATVSAHIVPVTTPFKQDGYTASAGKDGSASVTQIFFSGERFNFELGDVSAAKTAPGATTSGSN